MIGTEEIFDKIREKAQIPEDQLLGLLKQSAQDYLKFAVLVIQQKLLDRDSVGLIVGDSIRRSYVPLDKTLFDKDVVSRLPKDLAKKLQAIPIYKFGEAVTVAFARPNDQDRVEAAQKALGLEIDPVLSFPDEIEEAIQIQYVEPTKVQDVALTIDLSTIEKLTERELAECKPVVQICDSVVLLALKERASDIHIESKEKDVLVRFRIDGRIVNRLRLPVQLGPSVVARYKIMASMDIAERRKPQDGRIGFVTPVKKIDIRISTLPMIHGEKIVMRLLGSLSNSVQLKIDKIGIAEGILLPLKKALDEPNGMILVTGPTGSGKSTTLYAALNYLDSPDSNITTIEDPVEYEVTTLNQSQVDPKAGRTFAAILRSILRQDPDVVLIGETRDAETARIAAQAALTGHLVLTSLHTNNSIQAVTRLLDMGVEPFIVAPSLLGIVGQRLVRRICSSCIEVYLPEAESLKEFFYWHGDMELPQLYRGRGCDQCGGTGFRGRCGIHEFFRVNLEVKDYILKGKSYNEIRKLAYDSGFTDMRFDGFLKALQGLTTIEEVVRVTATE